MLGWDNFHRAIFTLLCHHLQQFCCDLCVLCLSLALPARSVSQSCFAESLRKAPDAISKLGCMAQSHAAVSVSEFVRLSSTEKKVLPFKRNPSQVMASLAQLVEHALRKRMVVGSIPTGGFKDENHGGQAA